mmetsp:Transcript_27374/g.33254  ORF Transcript_27374/g.33254 Transcript_27374/m.33254 type:complete len:238 (-) Transcript_27374:11-724(-)
MVGIPQRSPSISTAFLRRTAVQRRFQPLYLRAEGTEIGETKLQGETASSSSSSAAAAVNPTVQELLHLVSLSPSTATDERVTSIIDELAEQELAVDSAAFNGPWEVVWSEGTMAWRALVAQGVQAIAGESRAGQSFDLEAGTATNFAELFNGRVLITAEGTFTPATPDQEIERRYPAAFDVRIRSGKINIFGKALQLPISGPGYFEVLYGDASVRIFKSSGGVAVQVPSNWKEPSDC